jgi:hypothetical protein
MNSFQTAISKFDAYNGQDPNKEIVGGHPVSKEVAYAQRMSEWLTRFAPEAGEEVKLAARCQHIGRWQIPRKTFPEGRKGYLQWRGQLKDLHAEIAGDILRESGYDDKAVENVQYLLLKKDLQHNPESQLLEDVVCLVFIEHYLSDFARKHDPQKVIDILKKTVKKMSPAARSASAAIPLDEPTRKLLLSAL